MTTWKKLDKTKDWKDNFSPEEVNESLASKNYYYSIFNIKTEAEERLENIMSNISVSDLLSDPNFESIKLDEMNTAPDYYFLDRSELNQFPKDWNLEKVYEHLDEYGFYVELSSGWSPTVSYLVIYTKPSE